MSEFNIDKFNKCFYLNGEKDNASSMLKKCINGSDDLAWPCVAKQELNNELLNRNTERASQDNLKKERINDKGNDALFTSDKVEEGFTNMGESYVRPGWLPDGYFRCPKTGEIKQVCMNCKYNQNTYGKSKEFNEGDPCFPNKGVYNGITNQGLTKCTCGQKGQYCNDIFNAQGGLYADKVFIMNVGDYSKLGNLAAY